MNKDITLKVANVLGMPLDEWGYKSCVAHCATGEGWATLYDIESKEESKGHATKLLLALKEYYEGKGLVFGGNVALNNRIRRIYQRCGIKEYA